MLATRQVLGAVARRPKTMVGAANGIRRLATVSDSPLDKKVSIEGDSKSQALPACH